MAYVAASPSPYHAVAEAVRLLEGAGFTAVDPAGAWPAGGRHLVAGGGALVAWSVPEGAPAWAGFRVVGAHTDSPNLRVKPHPDVATAGWRQLAVDVYGGALVNSWLDRDLGLSGRVALAPGDGASGGEVRTALVRVERPVLRLPQLAIHLDRDVNERGVVLDRQQHLRPVWGLGTPTPDGFRRFLAEELGVDAARVLAWDVMAHDLTPPAYLGRDGELVASSRLDDQASCWCGLAALTAAPGEAGTVAVLALFDHEEVGSDSTTGAGGPLLEAVLERTVAAAGGGRDEWRRALAASWCVSADMAHAAHPNFLDRHEPNHLLVPNGGPAIKVNVQQRYATDATTAARFVALCERAGVPHQVYSHRSNLPCGSTIGPITATRLGIPTVDVGAPMLSMHSARELAGAHDAAHLRDALVAFYG
jgi:aspartyl aminopeptidase